MKWMECNTPTYIVVVSTVYRYYIYLEFEPIILTKSWRLYAYDCFFKSLQELINEVISVTRMCLIY
jgi:hypothetical protein